MNSVKKVKVAHTRLPSVGFGADPGSCSQPAGNVSHKPGGRTDSHLFTGTHYFLPGLQLPSQPLTGLLPISLHGEQKHDGCEQFA